MVQRPEPVSPPRRPLPTAVPSLRLTVTVTLPLAETRPETPVMSPDNTCPSMMLIR